MSKFAIYVKTSALGQTGIHWRYAKSEEEQPVETPSLIKCKVIERENGQKVIVNDLIDEVKPSLLILRDDLEQKQKLLLEVTGIESPQRSNQLGRIVLNSIVWIADDCEENEGVIRQLAYSAIQSFLQKDNSFSEMIQRSISFHGLEEFRVSLREVNNFVEQLEIAQNQQINDIELCQKYEIKDKSNNDLEKLAEDLQNYSLPKEWDGWNERRHNGVLVVITDNLEQKTILHEAGAWRGFASNAEAPVAKAVELPEKKTEILHPEKVLLFKKSQISPQTSQKTRQFRLICLGLTLLVGIIAILFIVFQIKLYHLQQYPFPEQLKRIFQPHY
jgi:hypothetical protein